MTQNLLRILLLLFVFGTCCGIQTDARKKNEKKRTPVIRTPEPDPEIIFTPLHANLTPQDEVMPPADREMRWKDVNFGAQIAARKNECRQQAC